MQKGQKKALTIVKNITKCLLLLLSVAAIIKTCLVSLDIDESYAIAQAYRMAVGDRMFADMWEPHQMSAFGAAIFIKPFLWVMQGSTTGIVIYLRVIGTVLHLLVGWWLYRVAAKRTSPDVAFIAAMLHLNFLPKWIQVPEFELMQYWFVLGLFLTMLSWSETANDENTIRYLPKWVRRADFWALLSGVLLFATMMTYPTMILLYPVYAVAFFGVQKGSINIRKRVRGMLLYTGCTIVIGILFLLYLRSYMTIPEFMDNVGFIFMDTSHTTQTAQSKLSDYGKELLTITETMLPIVGIALVGTIIEECISRAISRKRNRSLDKKFDFIRAWVIFSAVLTVAFGFWHLFGLLFGDQNQFFMYWRYACVTICGIIGVVVCKDKNRDCFWYGILPAIIGVIASVIVTNMSLEVSFARCYIGVIATVFIVYNLIIEKMPKDCVAIVMSKVAGVMLILGLLVCKLLLIRVTGCLPVTLKARGDLITNGPAKGLFVLEELSERINTNEAVLAQYVRSGDRVLYFGCENLYYLSVGAKMSTPTTQGTAVFNEMYPAYFAEHPEKMPNIIIIDKTFKDNPYVVYSPQNVIVETWIAENYEDAVVTETEYLRILRMQEGQ